MYEAIRARLVCTCNVSGIVADERSRIENDSNAREFNSDGSIKSAAQISKEDLQVVEEVNKEQENN
jgi:hypothetical protein